MNLAEEARQQEMEEALHRELDRLTRQIIKENILNLKDPYYIDSPIQYGLFGLYGNVLRTQYIFNIKNLKDEFSLSNE